MSYLNAGLPIPVPAADGLDREYWEGLQRDELMIQRCDDCGGWQWGPEWLCHHCQSFELSFQPVTAAGTIYSYERVWHPVHPALADQGAYVVVLVTLADAPGTRVVGNLLGDPRMEVPIGAEVEGVFEHHPDADPPYSLLQWRLVGAERSPA
jgi:uncharacterized OB-fold protein